jgi:hypothetical protein
MLTVMRVQVPALAFVWLEILSHRKFMVPLLKA